MLKINKSALLIAVIFLFSCKIYKHPTKNNLTSNPIQDKVKGYKKIPGLFVLFQDTLNGSTYMLVKQNQLKTPFIYFSHTVDGIAATGQIRGGFRDNRVFQLERYFDKIELKFIPTGYYFDAKHPISKSGLANINDAIVASLKIIAENKSNGEILIEAGPIFLQEALSQVKQPSNPGRFNLGALNKDKTKFVSLKNYPQNTDITVAYVYENTMPTAGGGREVTDDRYTSIQIQHSFIEAPVNQFKPRKDDPRIGYFMEEVDDMTSKNAVPYKDMIHRWNLQKKYPDSAVSEAVEPIVWWMEKTTPYEFRPIIEKAANRWNSAFEKAGFKNAIQIKQQPDSAEWDAGDIRYNVIRWVNSPQPAFGGYGPSFIDPRTGQILGADIMLEYIFVTNKIKQSNLFETFANKSEKGECMAGNLLHQSNLFASAAMDVLPANQKLKAKYLEQSIYYLILHEMGHTLGLNHNMKASQMLNCNQLNDTSITHTLGLTASVMDYPAVNIAPNAKDQGDFFTTIPGPYDVWAIQYGYTPDAGNDSLTQIQLDKLLANSSDTCLIFGNDADDMRSIGKGIDPRVNVNDMAKDALVFAENRFNLVNHLMDSLNVKFSDKGIGYQDLKQMYDIAQQEYFNQIQVVVKYIGGIKVDRSKTGIPYVPIDLKQQKQAMQLLSKYAFSEQAFVHHLKPLPFLQTQRRGFNFYSTTEDPKIHQKILNQQQMVLAQLLHPAVLKRMSDTKFYGNQYSLLAMFNDLTKACFSDEKASIGSIKQNLQNAYIDELIDIKTQNAVDGITQAAVTFQLKQIQSAIKIQGNEETRAHFESIKDKIYNCLNKNKG
jgi:hypothetical protein